MFATDVHLLPYEPRVFNDVAWAGQRLIDSLDAGTINALGDRLTVNGAAFDDWNVGPGWVVIVDGAPLEVVERINTTQLRISRLRVSPNEPVIRATPGAGLSVRIHTFRHQLDAAAKRILTMLGLVHSQDAGPGDVDEMAITNPASLRAPAVFGALTLIHAAAALEVPETAGFRERAALWAERFRIEMRHVRIGIDLTGDGLPTETRRVDVRTLTRGA